MTVKDLDLYLEQMPLRGVPECELAVSVDGELVYYKTVGREDLDRNICYVCSISKVTTCVAALRLVEEGKLSLDDPVEKYLPAYKNLMVKQPNGVKPAENKMTILHLFTMTGGLNYTLNTTPILRAVASNAGTVEVVNSFAESPLDFEPGTKFQYSLCHDVLAAVVEVVSGKRFSDYVKENIYGPLGMEDSGYHLPDELRPRLCRQYNYVNGANKAVEVEPNNKYILTPNYDSGGAGVYTTAIDQLKLMTALALGGTAKNGYRVLNLETVKMCEKGYLSDELLPGFFPTRLYGYNWGLCGRVHTKPEVSNGLSSAGEFGWDGATGPYALIDRKKGLAAYYGMHIYGCTISANKFQYDLRDRIVDIFAKK